MLNSTHERCSTPSCDTGESSCNNYTELLLVDDFEMACDSSKQYPTNSPAPAAHAVLQFLSKKYILQHSKHFILINYYYLAEENVQTQCLVSIRKVINILSRTLQLQMCAMPQETVQLPLLLSILPALVAWWFEFCSTGGTALIIRSITG